MAKEKEKPEVDVFKNSVIKELTRIEAVGDTTAEKLYEGDTTVS